MCVHDDGGHKEFYFIEKSEISALSFTPFIAKTDSAKGIVSLVLKCTMALGCVTFLDHDFFKH